ncbi:MAG TPA: RICIN domain-containing protein [Amycolatopsis sp.]|uniref:RICIN domain-containing protein n=1 Tax=Amycolatopsis sp. TaxID=37632 RepID=UPI002B482234|nr:RICIN domain-containing protein [Amycolatopsis sp.]HKS44201.1 RICIN domain-containing protein [Amycolatopsis sp.]
MRFLTRLAVAVAVASSVLTGMAMTTAHASTESVVPGYYQVINRQTGECLDVWGAATNHAATVGVWRCVGADNQQWKPVYTGDGFYEIRVLHTDMCLDVAYASQSAGAQVVQGTCWGGENQQWRPVPVDGTWYRLIARHSGMCLDKDYWGYAVQWSCGNGYWQQWAFL